MDFQLEADKTYFNATSLVSQHNLVSPKLKRLHNFTHISLRNSALIDLAATELNLPTLTVRGAGPYRATWLHMALLPAFLLWINPRWYVQYADAVVMVVPARSQASSQKTTEVKQAWEYQLWGL